jgi:hypothetical protein
MDGARVRLGVDSGKDAPDRGGFDIGVECGRRS